MKFDKERIRNKILAGILKEDLQLIPKIEGRSPQGTLGFFIEEFIILIATRTINSLDALLQSNQFNVAISQSSSKMAENSFTTKLQVSNITGKKKEYILNFTVNLNENSSLSSTIYSDGLTDKIHLSSHHSKEDVNKFIQDINNRILNSLKEGI